MKKSNINLENFLLDIDKAFNLINQFDKENIDEIDLKKIKKEAYKLKEKIQKDYSNNLDIKK